MTTLTFLEESKLIITFIFGIPISIVLEGILGHAPRETIKDCWDFLKSEVKGK